MYRMMNEYVAEFTAQLRQGLEIAGEFEMKEVPEFENVLILGLGGSGIGGTILSQLIADQCTVPISSSKDYTIPGFVGEQTLVIACSYSGNTEETLQALADAVIRNAHIACISAGGKLSEAAMDKKWPLIQIPTGYPPRAAFALSLIQLFKMADAYGLVMNDWQEEVEAAIKRLDENADQIKNTARQLAESIQGRLPVLYSSSWLDGVAVRWRQQINENAKTLAWTNVYPEMNHNELVGWRNENHDLVVIFLTSEFDHPRVMRRMELSEEVYRKYTPHIHHYKAQGESMLEQALYLINLGDWMTVYLADIKGADAVEVDVIDWLKGELAKTDL